MAARAVSNAAALLVGVSVGMVIERNREFGTEYWRANAQQSWQMHGEVLAERVNSARRIHNTR